MGVWELGEPYARIPAAGGADRLMRFAIDAADGSFDIVWDNIGLPHVYAETVADAYRGMGFAAASQRLWQIHLSTLYANGEVASVLGERFVKRDAVQRAFNVSGSLTGLPASEGDWLVDAYLQGLNAYIDTLTNVPPEFAQAGSAPRHFTRADVAARYRFTSWHQHRSWPEKMFLGALMARHGVARFRDHVLRFSEADAELVGQLKEPLAELNPGSIRFVYPEMAAVESGSNNWAIAGAHSKSGKPMLATDPHQPHSLPSTFFYVHLHVESWDVFGAAFPGVPYFMMGYTRDLAWGLTTGFIDNYDVYIEETAGDAVRTPDGFASIEHRQETIVVSGGADRVIDVASTRHGPLLEPLSVQLGLMGSHAGKYQTSVRWALADLPTSAGALARLPLAKNAEEFGEWLFENDVCPLVNNIICVDRDDNLRRFIAATLPVRKKVTGVVPLPGWDDRYDFALSKAEELVVEVNPACGYSLTANNDTLGEGGPYPIHNFPTFSARAERIEQLLEAGIRERSKFDTADFERMQLDLLDLRARDYLPSLIAELTGCEDSDVQLALEVLQEWDCRASVDAAGACLFYPFLAKQWHIEFMVRVLGDDTLRSLPAGAPALNRFTIADFLKPGSPWHAERELLTTTVRNTMKAVVADVADRLGGPEKWQWGDLQQIEFWHSLRNREPFSKLHAGPDRVGGSSTTLAMAAPIAVSGAEPAMYRVFHGPVYRLVVDLADPDHCRFVIAGGNASSAESSHVLDHYQTWLAGKYFNVSLVRDEITEEAVWCCGPSSE